MQNPTYPLVLSSGAHVTAGGQWTDASSRALKRDVAELPERAAAEALRALRPVSFEYKAQPGHTTLGFIAEDVPAAVAAANRTGLSAMPVAAVLARVAQTHDARLAALEAALARCTPCT